MKNRRSRVLTVRKIMYDDSNVFFLDLKEETVIPFTPKEVGNQCRPVVVCDRPSDGGGSPVERETESVLQ